MTKIVWDALADRVYETGVNHGVLYRQNGAGVYHIGYAWNGLTAINETPDGAEATPQYADNIKYLNLVSAENFNATIEAFTYPDEFAECDGTATPQSGVNIGQQPRKIFGLAWQTLVGNAVDGNEAGHKTHVAYGLLAAPSEKDHNTINDTPEAVQFSWDCSSTPVEIGVVDGVTYKPTAHMWFDSTKVDSAALTALENMLFGTVGTDPYLPDPATILALFSGTITTATPTEPTFDSETNTITIPTVTGVTYSINGEVVTGTVVITTNTVVNAAPNAGYKFPDVIVDAWLYTYTP